MAGKATTWSRGARQEPAASQNDGLDDFQDDGQNIEEPIELLSNILASVETRKSEKRTDLKNRHEIRVTEAEQGIETFFRVHKSAVCRYRRSQITKLSDLVKKRADLELKIIDHVRNMEDAYGSANNEIRAILEGKMRDLKKEYNAQALGEA